MSQTTSQKPFPLLLLKWKLLKRMVGAPRFELGTSWSRNKLHLSKPRVFNVPSANFH